MGKTLADESAECRVVPRPAADDDRDGASSGARRANDSARDSSNLQSIGCDETIDHLVGECGGIVEEAGHGELLQ